MAAATPSPARSPANYRGSNGNAIPPTPSGSSVSGRGAVSFARNPALQGDDEATSNVRASMSLLDQLGSETIRSLDTVAAAQQSIAQAKAHDSMLHDADVFQDQQIAALTFELNHLRRECSEIKHSMKQEKLLKATDLTGAIAHELEHMEALRREKFDLDAALLELETERFIHVQEALLLDPALKKTGGALFNNSRSLFSHRSKAGGSSRRTNKTRNSSPPASSGALLQVPGTGSMSISATQQQLMPNTSLNGGGSSDGGGLSRPVSPLMPPGDFGGSFAESVNDGGFVGGSRSASPTMRVSTPNTLAVAAEAERERTSVLTRDVLFDALLHMDNTAGAAAATRRADTQKPKSSLAAKVSASAPGPATGSRAVASAPKPSGEGTARPPSPFSPPSASAAAVRLESYLAQATVPTEADSRQLRALRSYAEGLASNAHRDASKRRAPHHLAGVGRSTSSLEIRTPAAAAGGTGGGGRSMTPTPSVGAPR